MRERASPGEGTVSAWPRSITTLRLSWNRKHVVGTPSEGGCQPGDRASLQAEELGVGFFFKVT